MTPIRVRGKRTGTKEEKWHAGKQRAPSRHGSLAASDQSSSGRSSSSLMRARARRSRKRNDPSLSRLEQLPTEMLQSIFEYSANIDLPLSSPRLASQLESRVLYQQLTSQVLPLVLGEQSSNTDRSGVANAMRLMNSRFFTWEFFQHWLHSEFERLGLRDEWWEAPGQNIEAPDVPRRQEEYIWHRLHPSPVLAPPTKLLRRPFTGDSIQFLKFLIASFRSDPETLDPLYRETVQDGLQEAVEDGAGDTLNAFFSLGAQVDTELLRKAVIDGGCREDVVQSLITRTMHLTSDSVNNVDFLDPAFWSWADRARAKGDEKGSWLLEQLKTAARDSGQQHGIVEGK